MANPPNLMNSMGFDDATMSALQAQQWSAGGPGANIAGNSAERMNDNAVFQGLNSLFPSPEQQSAQKTMAAMKGATLSQNPGESDEQFSLRQLHAQRDAVAPVNPLMAAQLNTKILLLGQQQKENDLANKGSGQKDRELDIENFKAQSEAQRVVAEQTQAGAAAERAKTESLRYKNIELPQAQREKTQFADEANQRELKGLLASYAWTGRPDDKSPLGYSMTGYDLHDPDDTTKLTDAVKRGEIVMGADKASDLLKSTDVASMKQAAALRQAMVDADIWTDDGLKGQYASCIITPSYCTKMKPETWARMRTLANNAGITVLDEAQAKNEMKSVGLYMGNIERRKANVAQLEGGIRIMGDQVLDFLPGYGNPNHEKISQSDIRLVNMALKAGNTQFNNPVWSRYAAALNGFITEYARGMAGGGTVTSDSARREAWENVDKLMSPDAAASAIDQMKGAEMDALSKAGDIALEAVARPESYPTLAKIIDTLGLNGHNKTTEDAANPKAPGPPKGANFGTAPAAKPPSASTTPLPTGPTTPAAVNASNAHAAHVGAQNTTGKQYMWNTQTKAFELAK